MAIIPATPGIFVVNAANRSGRIEIYRCPVIAWTTIDPATDDDGAFEAYGSLHPVVAGELSTAALNLETEEDDFLHMGVEFGTPVADEVWTERARARFADMKASRYVGR